MQELPVIRGGEPPCAYRQPHDEKNYICQHKDMIAENGVIPKKVCQFCTLHSTVADGAKLREVGTVTEGGKTRPVVMARPGLLQMAWDLGRELAKYVANGAHNVSEEDYQARMKVCNECPFRQGNACTLLGCNCMLNKKAMMLHTKCPKDKWAK